MKCEYCDKEFNTLYALNAHRGRKHKEQLLQRNIKIGNDILDITYMELENFRKNHSNECDICGKYETTNTRPDAKNTPNNLCIDHNHITKESRGFICVQCNRNMGWLDRYKEQIEKYNKPYKFKVKK